MKTKLSIFREEEHKFTHHVLEGAPDQWALDRGATHTLDCGNWGTRPARLTKTRLYVGVDEAADGSIVWETWRGRVQTVWENVDAPESLVLAS
jgi:hypothetical protein